MKLVSGREFNFFLLEELQCLLHVFFILVHPDNGDGEIIGVNKALRHIDQWLCDVLLLSLL